jgi:cytochrome P450
MEVETDLPQTRVDFQDYDFNIDPYPLLRRIQSLGPVVYHKDLDQYLITTFKDGSRVLGNAAGFRQPAEQYRSMFGGDTMLSMTGERQKSVRGIWARHFVGPGLEKQRQAVTDIVHSRLDEFVARVNSGETVEAVGAMTRAIPSLVIAQLLGIPPADRQEFCQWSDDISGLAEGVVNKSERAKELLEIGRESVDSLNRYATSALTSGEHLEADDLIGVLLASPVADTMSPEEKAASVTQAVFGGNETTAKLMSTALFALSAHPDQRAALRGNPKWISQAVEEVNRWQSVAQAQWRVAGPDAVAAGVSIPEGSGIVILSGIANRDAERWTDPDKFDIYRERRAHLGFGWGNHLCLGMNLARMEVEIWLEALLDKLPAWQMTSVDWGLGWGAARGPVEIYIQRQIT